MHINAKVMIVGGGEIARDAFLTARERCDFLLAADGGADATLDFGARPDAIVGDMDSISARARASIPAAQVYAQTDQDSTDFQKALALVDAPMTLAVGFTGKRIDHELAALHALACYPHRAIVLLAAEDVIFHVPAGLTLALPPQCRVSLFPLSEVRVTATGLRWPEGHYDLRLGPMGRIGTSNEALDGPVELSTDRPGLLGILPLMALDAAVVGLAAAEFHSPPLGG